MNQFPSTPASAYPLSVTSEFRTLTSAFETGREQRRQAWTFPKRTIKLTFSGVKQTNIDTLWNFYNQQRGAYDPFWFYDPTTDSSGNHHTHQGEYVSRGNGTSTVFELPGKSINSSTLTVYVNGVSTAAYTFSQGTGDAGSDRIIFTAAPASGSTITADFTGSIRYRVRFSEDQFSKELFIWVLWNSEISLKEVRV